MWASVYITAIFEPYEVPLYLCKADLKHYPQKRKEAVLIWELLPPIRKAIPREVPNR